MIDIKDVSKARERIRNIVKKTPIITSLELSRTCGNNVYLKAEHLQKTGSFKIRGASNKVLAILENRAMKFVTAASSGNHGQAVAYITQHLHIPSTIVVPIDAKQCKLNAIRAYNGKIEFCGTTSSERIEKAIKLAQQGNGEFIPPYDDEEIIAGQGTIGLELLEQISNIDIVVIPIGGGGLISGNLIALKSLNPKIKVIGVEPAIANDTYLSFKNKKITSIPSITTIADGLRALKPGNLTFEIMSKYLDDVVLVSELEIKQTLKFVYERTKQLIEPSSATVIAAVMFKKFPAEQLNIACIVSGGNSDLKEILELVYKDEKEEGV
ncbi:threonine ammonia-lyase [Rummeliibacillus suwonensis]|uniref:threonine ammonia-lyase n=1 Tax=Rummeliibacillus suwonensis TaxID=1306154 RepID=UPI001AAFC988|nr:threonine/serine dehydratase [Rummeliibacillus suwonensis]MBO2537425.1 threonine/serine dehydratase [Rummeliibacillus suwonensis]